VTVADGKLVRYDLSTGGAVEHAFGTAESPGGPGEAVFVPSTAGPADESSGWYIGYVYDQVRDGSDLVIIDASDFAAQPVARIKLPHRVPFGFHGNWIAG
jgi:carotenoid cleavage dioxygenase